MNADKWFKIFLALDEGKTYAPGDIVMQLSKIIPDSEDRDQVFAGFRQYVEYIR